MRAAFISTAVFACILVACLPVAYLAGRASVSDKHEVKIVRPAERVSFESREEHHPRRMMQMKDNEIKNENDLPYSFETDYQTRRYYQENRGTCWAFASIGILEQSYRQNGVEKGFLNASEYVRFSEQAYGISVMNACKKHPDICDVPGDEAFQDSTEGGEVWWLYYLKELYTKILPHSVCEYPLDTGYDNEHRCEGMDKALEKNPLKFDIKKMETAYNVFETKRMMVTHNAPVAWSSAMHDRVYYFPCTDPYWKGTLECSSRLQVKCPTDRYYGSQYCARVVGPMFDMDGELFIMDGEIVQDGGHAMNVVAYNDGFTTKQGYTGGFVIRNSWHDEVYYNEPGRGARGSHSIAFWMQKISEWDERKICPGPLNPENWMSCVVENAGPHGDVVKDDDKYNVTNCLDDNYMKHAVENSLQPVEFECLDDLICDKGANFRYFLIRLDHSAQQDLVKATMLRYDTKTQQSALIETPYHFSGKLSYWFRPVKWQLDVLKDDEDLCGYWFWPYDVINKQVGLLQQFFTTYFEIEWDDQSYVANEAKHTDLDYSLIKSSTASLNTLYTFSPDGFYSPSPFPKQRYD